MKQRTKDLLYLFLALILISLLLEGLRGLIHVPERYLLHVCGLFLAALIGFTVKFVALRSEIGALMDHSASIDKSIRRPVLCFLRPKLESYLTESRRLTGEGIQLTKEELVQLADTSFSFCRDSYQGTDSHVPSDFNNLYTGYVKLQMDRSDSGNHQDSRFLLVSRESLLEDFKRHPEESTEFVRLHSNTGNLLYRVDPDVAAQLKNRYSLYSTEIGVFGWKFAIFFNPPERPAGRHKVVILPLHKELAENVGLYLIALNKRAEKITLSESGLVFGKRDDQQIDAQRKRMFDGKDWPPQLKNPWLS